MEFIQYIKQFERLSAEAENDLRENLLTEEYSKNSIVRSIDNFSRKVLFVEKGFVRIFYYREDRDITSFFLDENQLSLPIDSIFYGKPCRYGIEAIEDTIISSILYSDLERIVNKYPFLERLARLQLIKALRTLSEKLYAVQFQTAQERYNSMIASNPNILQRVSLGHIASYLGITQETLSRIRSGK